MFQTGWCVFKIPSPISFQLFCEVIRALFKVRMQKPSQWKWSVQISRTNSGLVLCRCLFQTCPPMSESLSSCSLSFIGPIDVIKRFLLKIFRFNSLRFHHWGFLCKKLPLLRWFLYSSVHAQTLSASINGYAPKNICTLSLLCCKFCSKMDTFISIKKD